jgi:hypothetical protein
MIHLKIFIKYINFERVFPFGGCFFSSLQFEHPIFNLHAHTADIFEKSESSLPYSSCSLECRNRIACGSAEIVLRADIGPGIRIGASRPAGLRSAARVGEARH